MQSFGLVHAESAKNHFSKGKQWLTTRTKKDANTSKSLRKWPMGSRSALIYYLIKEFLVLVAYFRIFLVVLLQDMATLKLTDRSLPHGVRWVRIMSLCSQTLISSTLSPKESNLWLKNITKVTFKITEFIGVVTGAFSVTCVSNILFLRAHRLKGNNHCKMGNIVC